MKNEITTDRAAHLARKTQSWSLFSSPLAPVLVPHRTQKATTIFQPPAATRFIMIVLLRGGRDFPCIAVSRVFSLPHTHQSISLVGSNFFDTAGIVLADAEGAVTLLSQDRSCHEENTTLHDTQICLPAKPPPRLYPSAGHPIIQNQQHRYHNNSIVLPPVTFPLSASLSVRTA
jgi:hypothetical protein